MVGNLYRSKKYVIKPRNIPIKTFLLTIMLSILILGKWFDIPKNCTRTSSVSRPEGNVADVDGGSRGMKGRLLCYRKDF